jgi:glycosyltransferase involved in cell wall biosynthesis
MTHDPGRRMRMPHRRRVRMPRIGSSQLGGLTSDPAQNVDPERGARCFDGSRPASVSKRPTVLVVGSRPLPYNGMTVVTDTILTSELCRHFDVVHVDTSDHRPVSTIARLDVRNILLALRASASLIHTLLSRDIDVVYVPIAKNRLGFLRDALLLIPSRLFKRPTIVHFHAEGFAEFVRSQPRWMQLLIALCLKGDRNHAVVLGNRLSHQFDGLILQERVHVVPNSVADYGVSHTSAPRTRPTVLYLSTLWSAKGIFEVLASASRIKTLFPGVQYIFAGDWYSQHEARAAALFIARHELADTVSMRGPVGPAVKGRLLAEATVMAFPSHSEGHPLVILEALSAGLPVVASTVGAIPEIIRDGKEGFLVPPRDADLLARRLAQVLGDADLRNRLGAAARRRYEEKFTEQHFVQGLGAVWASAAGADRRAVARGSS